MRNSIVFARGRVVSWPRSTRAGGSLLTCPRRFVPTSSPIRGMRRTHDSGVCRPHALRPERSGASWMVTSSAEQCDEDAGGEGAGCEAVTIVGLRLSPCDPAPIDDGPTTQDERRRARCTGCRHAPVQESIGRVGASSGSVPGDRPLLERPIRRSRSIRLDTRKRRTACALGSWGKARFVPGSAGRAAGWVRCLRSDRWLRCRSLS